MLISVILSQSIGSVEINNVCLKKINAIICFCCFPCAAYSPLVAMMPRAMNALRLTSLLLCAMSIQRGSRAPRPSRETLFSSPDNRVSQQANKIKYGSNAYRRHYEMKDVGIKN